jgi:hypothetical protein
MLALSAVDDEFARGPELFKPVPTPASSFFPKLERSSLSPSFSLATRHSSLATSSCKFFPYVSYVNPRGWCTGFFVRPIGLTFLNNLLSLLSIFSITCALSRFPYHIYLLLPQ